MQQFKKYDLEKKLQSILNLSNLNEGLKINPINKNLVDRCIDLHFTFYYAGSSQRREEGWGIILVWEDWRGFGFTEIVSICTYDLIL